MEHLLLERNGVELAAIPLGDAGLEIGAAPGNGLRLRGTDVRPYHVVLRRRRHRWWAVGRGGPIRVSGGAEAGEIALEPGVALAVGAYRLAVAQERRDESPGPPPVADRTRPLGPSVGTPAPALVLRIPGPDGRLEHRRLEPGTLVLGRAADCHVVLADPSVSARHARIVVDTRGAVLEDLASLNGCWLDGRRVWVADLAPGTTLCLGTVELHVLGPSTADHRGARGPMRPVFPAGLQPALELLRRAARSREPCVLLGETGSGKELLARRLHELGPRPGGPFVAVNAAALPRELAESILFGHRRGAFTGAQESHRGAFERADGGTLLLDELGDAPLELQAKLLRAIEQGCIIPVGAERPIDVDVRVVAATNRDLPAAVREGRFRLDLWHRLSVFVVRIPPLRERPGDLAALAQAVLDSIAEGPRPRRLSAAALEVLRGQRWPGNVRELRNVLLRAAASVEDEVIDAPPVRRALDDAAAVGLDPPGPTDPESLLVRHRGNVSAAARAAGLARSTFRERLASWRDGRANGS